MALCSVLHRRESLVYFVSLVSLVSLVLLVSLVSLASGTGLNVHLEVLTQKLCFLPACSLFLRAATHLMVNCVEIHRKFAPLDGSARTRSAWKGSSRTVQCAEQQQVHVMWQKCALGTVPAARQTLFNLSRSLAEQQLVSVMLQRSALVPLQTVVQTCFGLPAFSAERQAEFAIGQSSVLVTIPSAHQTSLRLPQPSADSLRDLVIWKRLALGPVHTVAPTCLHQQAPSAKKQVAFVIQQARALEEVVHAPQTLCGLLHSCAERLKATVMLEKDARVQAPPAQQI